MLVVGLGTADTTIEFRHDVDVERALVFHFPVQWRGLLHEEGVEFQSQGVFHVVQTRRTCTIFLLDFFHTVSLPMFVVKLRQAHLESVSGIETRLFIYPFRDSSW